jgi:hypothetical protein
MPGHSEHFAQLADRSRMREREDRAIADIEANGFPPKEEPWRDVTFIVTLDMPRGVRAQVQFTAAPATPDPRAAAWAYARRSLKDMPDVWKATVAAFHTHRGGWLGEEYGYLRRDGSESIPHHARTWEDGERCPYSDCGGHLRHEPDGDCACHVLAPCSACVPGRFRCDGCGINPAEGVTDDVVKAAGRGVAALKAAMEG